MSAEQKQLILGALDSLAVALTNYGHVWTDGERAIYEQASQLLGAEPELEGEQQ